MGFPNYPQKHESQPVLNPEDILNFRRRLGQMPSIRAPQAVLICLQRGLPARMRWRMPIQHVGRLMGDLFVYKKSHGQVAILTNIGIGAPQMVSLAEELVAWGARRLVSLVWGGGLQPDLKAGDIVICDRALRDEGTSHHYLPSEKYVSASPSLIQHLSRAFASQGLPFQIGATWSIDAPYRETRDEVQQYQSEGVKTVEMEIAGLLALGQCRQIETASVVIVGDLLSDMRWRAPDDTRPVEKSLEQAYTAILEALIQK